MDKIDVSVVYVTYNSVVQRNGIKVEVIQLKSMDV